MNKSEFQLHWVFSDEDMERITLCMEINVGKITKISLDKLQYDTVYYN